MSQGLHGERGGPRHDRLASCAPLFAYNEQNERASVQAMLNRLGLISGP